MNVDEQYLSRTEPGSSAPPRLAASRARISGMLLGMASLWVLMAALGAGTMMKYELTPGRAGTPPVDWPAASGLQRDATRATLVMFAHPRCACTRASVGELARIMAQGQGRVAAQVIFFKPKAAADDWAATDVWRSAANIPNVRVASDEGGVEAQRFQADTSGFAILYDASGRMLFRGGITSARGHAGDNDGRSAIAALLNQAKPVREQTPVFGCSLLTPSNPGPQNP